MVSNGEARGEETEHQEGLCRGLVLDIVLDRIRQEELELEEYLQNTQAIFIAFSSFNPDCAPKMIYTISVSVAT